MIYTSDNFTTITFPKPFGTQVTGWHIWDEQRKGEAYIHNHGVAVNSLREVTFANIVMIDDLKDGSYVYTLDLYGGGELRGLLRVEGSTPTTDEYQSNNNNVVYNG